MRRIIVGTAILVGMALAGAPATALGQSSYGASQRSAVPPGQSSTAGRAPYGGQQTGAQSYRGGSSSQGQSSSGQGSYGQRSYGQGSSSQASYGQTFGGQGGYSQGSYGGQQDYAATGPAPCREDDDLESLRCHHRTHSRGWYRDNEREAYNRGDHYRGYQDDGIGHRYYDRGGYGVGHDDYTRDYDPLRGY
jgi:hypothetical protein